MGFLKEKRGTTKRAEFLGAVGAIVGAVSTVKGAVDSMKGSKAKASSAQAAQPAQPAQQVPQAGKGNEPSIFMAIPQQHAETVIKIIT